MTVNKGGRPKTITVTPEEVVRMREVCDYAPQMPWPAVAKRLGLSRSSAIKLYNEAKAAKQK